MGGGGGILNPGDNGIYNPGENPNPSKEEARRARGLLRRIFDYADSFTGHRLRNILIRAKRLSSSGLRANPREILSTYSFQSDWRNILIGAKRPVFSSGLLASPREIPSLDFRCCHSFSTKGRKFIPVMSLTPLWDTPGARWGPLGHTMDSD